MCSVCKEFNGERFCKCGRKICYEHGMFGDRATRPAITVDGQIMCDHCGMRHDTHGKSKQELIDECPSGKSALIGEPRRRTGHRDTSLPSTLHGYGPHPVKLAKIEQVERDRKLKELDGVRSEYLSTVEMGKKMGMTRSYIGAMIRSGKIVATRFPRSAFKLSNGQGFFWLIHKNEARRFERERANRLRRLGRKSQAST